MMKSKPTNKLHPLFQENLRHWLGREPTKVELAVAREAVRTHSPITAPPQKMNPHTIDESVRALREGHGPWTLKEIALRLLGTLPPGLERDEEDIFTREDVEVLRWCAETIRDSSGLNEYYFHANEADSIAARIEAQLNARKKADDGSGIVSPEGPPVEESLAESAKGGPAGHPELGEPKVVGYVSEVYLGAVFGNGTITKKKDHYYDIPVILQSDHEAVVRGLRERLERTEARRRVAEDCIHKLQLAHHEEIERLREERDRLKAENERLNEEGELLQKQRDVAEKEYGELSQRFEKLWDRWDHTKKLVRRTLEERDESREEVEGLRNRATRLHHENNKLRRERDAYADPGNWQVGLQHASYRPTYTGPTPSDSTEKESVDESVEGRVVRRYGTMESPMTEFCVQTPAGDWPFAPGTPVKITRIPTPGGNDGEE